jgi:hypothetical protein
MKLKKLWRKIVDFFVFIGTIILGIITAFKLNSYLEKDKKQKNWKPIKNKPDYVNIYNEGVWKEIKLPKNKEGKQIKNNEIQTINISEKGKINVKIKSGATDRRGVSLDDDVFTPMDL